MFVSHSMFLLFHFFVLFVIFVVKLFFSTVSPSPTTPQQVAATGDLNQAREHLEQAEKEQRQKNRRAVLEHLEKAEQEVSAPVGSRRSNHQ